MWGSVNNQSRRELNTHYWCYDPWIYRRFVRQSGSIYIGQVAQRSMLMCYMQWQGLVSVRLNEGFRDDSVDAVQSSLLNCVE